jgi:hypothetical protein
MLSNKFTSASSHASSKDVEHSGIFNNTASNSMMQTLEEEQIFRAPNKWETLHVQSHWKAGRGSTRVGRPSIKLRKMHSRNIIFTAFDNLMFMPIYLFEQSRNQPKRAATTVLVLLVLAIVGSSAEKLDTHSKYSSQLKKSVLQSFRKLQHYLPHCC